MIPGNPIAKTVALLLGMAFWGAIAVLAARDGEQADHGIPWEVFSTPD